MAARDVNVRQPLRSVSNPHAAWHKPTLWERIGDILRWGRENGQPPIWMGALIVGLTFGVIALIVHGLGG
jgi:hypothetical protein